jgi:hypothetical protein
MKLLITLASIALLTASAMAADGPIRHVVAFKFKKDAAQNRVKLVEQSFAALKGKIPEITFLEWGKNISPEKFDKGFTHCWILSFKSEKDRDVYLEHPDHKEFGKTLDGIIDDIFVVDFSPES